MMKAKLLSCGIPTSATRVSAEDFERACGTQYISKTNIGTRIAFGMQLAANEAGKVVSLAMSETDSTKSAQDFQDIVTELVQKSLGRGLEWSSEDSAGPLVASSSNIAESFAAFKAAFLASVNTDVVVSGTVKAYPATLLKKIIR